MSEQILDAIKTWITQAFGGGVLPFGFDLSVASKILADKSRSGLYEAAGRGELEFVKDGAKTIVTTDSLISYLERMQSVTIKPTPPRKWKSRAKAPATSSRQRRQSSDRQQTTTAIQSG
jgi:hypothetical protein